MRSFIQLKFESAKIMIKNGMSIKVELFLKKIDYLIKNLLAPGFVVAYLMYNSG